MDRCCRRCRLRKDELHCARPFKAVMDGKQVAVLGLPRPGPAALRYFRQRLAAYPRRLRCFPVFAHHANRIISSKRLSAGGIDIVIGTHRLIQSDVRSKTWDLVVIDEEQRFGVTQKNT